MASFWQLCKYHLKTTVALAKEQSEFYNFNQSNFSAYGEHFTQ